MLTIFSAFDYPDKFMKNVFTGQTLGAIAALICTWCLWPFADSSWQMTLLIVPIIVSGIFIFAHGRLILIAFDYIMVSLILLQPSYPFSLSLPTSIGNAIAIICGPLVAMIAFKYIYPASPKKRYSHLIKLSEQQFNQGLTQITQGNKPSTSQLTHRLLNGLILAKKSDLAFDPVISFFEVRQGIWLNLLMLYKKSAHSPSQRRALKALSLRLQQDLLNTIKIEQIIHRLQYRGCNAIALMQLRSYSKKL